METLKKIGNLILLIIVAVALATCITWGAWYAWGWIGGGPAPGVESAKVVKSETPAPAPVAAPAKLQAEMIKLRGDVDQLREDLDMVMAVKFPKAKKK